MKETQESKQQKNTEPTAEDLASPLFNAIWNAIKGWDIERMHGEGYSAATGTDVKTILNAIEKIKEEE